MEERGKNILQKKITAKEKKNLSAYTSAGILSTLLTEVYSLQLICHGSMNASLCPQEQLKMF